MSLYLESAVCPARCKLHLNPTTHRSIMAAVASSGGPFAPQVGLRRQKGILTTRSLASMDYWRYTQEKMEQFIQEGRVAIPPGGEVPR